jgi:hypothetical protein
MSCSSSTSGSPARARRPALDPRPGRPADHRQRRPERDGRREHEPRGGLPRGGVILGLDRGLNWLATARRGCVTRSRATRSSLVEDGHVRPDALRAAGFTSPSSASSSARAASSARARPWRLPRAERPAQRDPPCGRRTLEVRPDHRVGPRSDDAALEAVGRWAAWATGVDGDARQAVRDLLLTRAGPPRRQPRPPPSATRRRRRAAPRGRPSGGAGARPDPGEGVAPVLRASPSRGPPRRTSGPRGACPRSRAPRPSSRTSAARRAVLPAVEDQQRRLDPLGR